MAGSRNVRHRLLEPTDIASLVFFRIVFGAIMVWECWRYFRYGWIKGTFIAPKFLFTYPGFDWVTPWSGDGMYYHFLAMGVLAFFILAGFLYRISAIFFFLAFTYVFLLSETNYLNHFYLVILVSFVMIFVPAHRSLSVDAWMRKSIRSDWRSASCASRHSQHVARCASSSVWSASSISQSMRALINK